MIHGIDRCRLPELFPTDKHDREFWEWLGRAVATYGFLEDVLLRAVFVFTGSRIVPEDQIEEELKKWSKMMRYAVGDTLGTLIKRYSVALQEHPETEFENYEVLVLKLHSAATLRNILCHSSWGPPDANGASMPFFMNRNMESVATKMDHKFFRDVHVHVKELAISVIETVIQQGWKFPGSDGPGKAIW